MTDISASQLSLIRTQPQEVELRLSIYKPNTVLACKVNNASIARGARSIAYNNVSSGSYTKVVSGMTMWVGSTLGGKDYGKVRVRSATSSVITVSENSDIDWADELFLTIIDVIDIVPIFPRIIKNPANEEDTIWYKDYDIAYTNQNKVLGSFICMGPHRAGDLDENGEVQFYFSASGTQNVLGDSLTYLWEFDGADGITGSTVQTPGWIKYKTEGHNTAKLTVTSGGGAVDYSYRYVSRYNKTTRAKDWEIVAGQGSRDSGGVTTAIKINKPYGYEIYDGAIVVVYSGDEWYGNTQTFLGGNSENNSSIYFVGYIIENSITWDYEKSTVEFQVASISDIMKSTNGFAISLEGIRSDPTTWYQMRYNTIKKSVYHFLRWHSTVLMTTDFQFLATDRYVQYFDSDRQSVFDAVNSFLQSALMAELVSDFQGKLWVETSMMATHEAKTAYPVKFALNKNDWMGEPNIQERPYNQVSYIEMGGIAYSPVADTSLPILAAAPGSAPSTHGKVNSPNGLALLSQTQLNELVGDVFAFKNAKKPTISMNMRGAYKNFDIAPLKSYQVQVAEEDTSKNIAVDAPYYIESINFTYSGRESHLRISIGLREITEGIVGETVTIPPESPSDVPSLPDIPSFPPIWTPPPIYYPPVDIPWVSPGILAIFLRGTTDSRLWFTVDLNTSSDPVWYAATTAFSWTLAELAGISSFKMNRWGRAYLIGRGDGEVDPANTWVYSQMVGVEERSTLADYAYFTSQIGAGPSIKAWGLDYLVDKKIAVWATEAYPGTVSAGFLSGGLDSLTMTLNSSARYLAELIGEITHYNDKWYLTMAFGLGQTRALTRFSSAFTFPPEDDVLVDGRSQAHALEADFNYLYPAGPLQTDEGMTTVRNIAGNVALDNIQNLACDPTGQYVMKGSAANDGEIEFSDDYGATFTVLTSFPHHHSIIDSTIRVVNLGTAYEWLVCYNQSPSATLEIQYTFDSGSTWQSKIGNLLDYADDDSAIIGVHFA